MAYFSFIRCIIFLVVVLHQIYTLMALLTDFNLRNVSITAGAAITSYLLVRVS